jgi:hypothetical protein
MRIALTFHEQVSDASLQCLDFALTRQPKSWQLSDIAFHPSARLTLTSGAVSLTTYWT